VFSPDEGLVAFGTEEGAIRLVLTGADQEVARLPTPEGERLWPQRFTPDGRQLLALGRESGSLSVFDLGRIRAQLAELGLDWDAPPYPPGRPEDDNPALAPPLRVEVVGGEAAADPQKLAEAECRRAVAELSFNPFDADAHYRLGARLLELGKPEQAYPHLGAALAFGGDGVTVRRTRAAAASQLRLWAEARDDATRCLEAAPDDHGARSRRAEANRSLKRYEEAVADYTALIASYPDVSEWYELRAVCSEAIGKPRRARADQERARKLAPDKGEHLHARAWQLLTGPGELRDPARALPLVQRALLQQPVNPAFLSTLGVAQYRLGLYREGLTTLQRSLAAGGQRRGCNLFFLALARAQLGDAPRAQECFDRAAKWLQEQDALRPEDARQLKDFQAEAESLLRKVPKTRPSGDAGR
jgi:tetratricopeptide (TPR) repeat protein